MTDIQGEIEKWVDRDRDQIVDLFSRLVQCRTPSPPGDTRDAMAVVQAFLREQGLPFTEVTAEETMPNLLSSIQGPASGRHLMFSGHLDVLPAGDEPGWTADPWSGHVADGRVWGRGASDMKGGLTAMLYAYSYVARLREHVHGRLSIAVASDEETGMGRGTAYLFDQVEDQLLADGVLAAEPSGTYAVTFSEKGYLGFTVTVTTRGAISGYPNASDSAIRIAADIVRELDALEDLAVELPAPMADLLADRAYVRDLDYTYGEGSAELISAVSMNVGTITGGQSASVIAPSCTFEATVVVPVGTDPQVVFDTARQIVEAHPEAQIRLDSTSAATMSPPDHELVRLLQRTVTELGWPEPLAVPDVAASDLFHWRTRGIPGYWYGPDGEHVSAANESVDIEEVLHLVRTYTLTAIAFLTEETTP